MLVPSDTFFLFNIEDSDDHNDDDDDDDDVATRCHFYFFNPCFYSFLSPLLLASAPFCSATSKTEAAAQIMGDCANVACVRGNQTACVRDGGHQ